MLGFGALGQFALGEGPFAQTLAFGSKFSEPIKKAGLTAAVIATTFVGFVPPPPAQAARVFTKFSEPLKKPSQAQHALWRFSIPPARTQTAIFSQFSQPAPTKNTLGKQPNWQFETVPALAPFTGFAKFSEPLRAKSIVQFGSFESRHLFVPPPDTHDGVFVKKKRKKHARDPIDLELEEKAKRRAAIELAIYGPEVVYQAPAATIAKVAPAPPNVEELARVIVQAQAAEREAQRQALEQDDEEILEFILRDL